MSSHDTGGFAFTPVASHDTGGFRFTPMTLHYIGGFTFTLVGLHYTVAYITSHLWLQTATMVSHCASGFTVTWWLHIMLVTSNFSDPLIYTLQVA